MACDQPKRRVRSAGEGGTTTAAGTCSAPSIHLNAIENRDSPPFTLQSLCRPHHVQLFLNIDLHPPDIIHVHPALVPHQLVVGAMVVHRAIGRCKCLLEVILGPPLLNRVGGDWEEDPRSPDKNEGSQAYALAHPSPHTGDVSGESYAEWPVALEGNNWTRDPPGKGGDLFFGRSPLTTPKSKGDQLLTYKLGPHSCAPKSKRETTLHWPKCADRVASTNTGSVVGRKN